MYGNRLLQKIAFGKYLGKYISRGNGKSDPKVELFYRDIDPSLAEKYLDYRYNETAKYASSGGYLMDVLSSERGLIVIRMRASEVNLNDPEFHEIYKGIMPIWSADVFDNRPIEIILTDEMFNDKRRIAMKEAPQETTMPAETVTPKETVKSDKGQVEEYRKAAAALQAASKFEDAIVQYTKVLEADPQHVNALINRALCSYVVEKYNTVIEDCKKVLVIAPDSCDDICYWYLGMSNYRLDKSGEALSYLQKTFELEASGKKTQDWWNDDQFKIASTALGQLLVERRRYVEAIETYNKAMLRMEGQDQELLLSRAVAYYLTKQNEEAINDFTKAIKQKPGHLPMIYVLRGLVYIQTGDFDKALADAQKSEMLNPEPGAELLALKSMAHYYLKKGTVGDVDNALKQFPNEGILLYAKGRILLDMGDKASAITCLELAADFGSQEAELLIDELN